MTHTDSRVTFLGVDVSKLRLDAHVGSDRHKRFHLGVDNTLSGFEQLLAWLAPQKLGQIHVCLEATGTYSDAFALFLRQAGYPVSIVPPHKFSGFRRSEGITSKTDRIDAWLLARFGEQKQKELLLWTPRSPALEQLRRDLDRYDEYEQMYRMEANRFQENLRLDEEAKADLKEHLDYLQKKKDSWFLRLQHRLRQMWAQEHPETETQPLPAERQPKIVQTKTRRKPPFGIRQVDLLQDLCGFQLLSALRLFSVMGDVERFPSARHAASYFGVTPVSKSSGTSVHGKPMVYRRGNSTARAWLYLSAVSCMTHDPDMRQWAKELEARGHKKQAIVIAVMNKLVRIIYGIYTTDRPYDPKAAFPTHSQQEPAQPLEVPASAA